MIRMRNKILLIVTTIVFASCGKDPVAPPSPPAPPVPTDTTTLKQVASFPVGVAISYDLMKNNSSYSSLVKKEFDRVTFEYQMKHGANVKNDGSYDFSRADELVGIIQAAGMDVYGHTLVWHQNNNGNYLRSLTNTSGSNLVLNPGFENDFTNWFTQVSSTPPTAGNISIVNTNVQSGTKAARVNVTTPGPNPYSVQIVSDNFTVTSATTYTLKYWARAATAGQALRAVAQGTSYYEQLNQSLTTTWTEYSFPFTPTESAVSIKFHFPNAGDFYIDNLSVFAPSSGLDPTLINSAMQNWITAMVGRNAGKVKAWDVVNEAFEENGSIRTGTSSGDAFYWAPVLGRSYIGNAFRYANAADPAALLFLNDYNLEWSAQKLDSFISMVNELKNQTVPIHGVATQMHININISNSAIDNMFIKLASTGLKVHVSELDIRINPNNASPFNATEDLLNQQAQKYKYVAESYFNNVPASQRYGITVWNLTDADSWIVTSLGRTDFPTLFTGSYQKKPAYTSFKQGLK
ncbi:MAG TPA: endo-1,4-beta-xylanase [Chitinophagaceae bacterium]